MYYRDTCILCTRITYSVLLKTSIQLNIVALFIQQKRMNEVSFRVQPGVYSTYSIEKGMDEAPYRISGILHLTKEDE